MQTSYLIKPFEQHPDFEELVKDVPTYYQKDKEGDLKLKNGKPIKNEDWFREAVGFQNPFFVEMVREVRTLGTKNTRLDGTTETTGMWVDFGCPKEEQLPLVAGLFVRYSSWSKTMPRHPGVQPYRYCYVSVEWSKS